jgi:hypothetical protein
MTRTLRAVIIALGAIVFFACNETSNYDVLSNDEFLVLAESIERVHSGAEDTYTGLYYFN